jgi:hypothetical protein
MQGGDTMTPNTLGERRNRRKPKWLPKTRTFIVNALILAVTISTYVLSAPELKETIKDYSLWIVAGTNIANIILRQLTTQPAAWTSPPAETGGEVGDD